MKILSVWGVFTPVSFVATVKLDGSLRHSYHYMKQTGSEMIETGALNKLLLDTLFPVHDRLVGIISSGLRIRA